MAKVRVVVGWASIAATREDYSFAIISRRSAMCCLIRAICCGQESAPRYGTPAAYSRSASASASRECSSFCWSVGPGIGEGYHLRGLECLTGICREFSLRWPRTFCGSLRVEGRCSGRLSLIKLGEMHQTRLQETFYERRDCEEDKGTG